MMASHIELYDPQQRDEQEVEGDEEAEGPPHVRDALLLPGFVRLHPGVDGRGGVGEPHPSAGQPRVGVAAASAVHPHPNPPLRAPPTGRQKVESEEAGHGSRRPRRFRGCGLALQT